MKRLLYLCYYTKRLDWEKFRLFKNWLIVKNGTSNLKIWFSILHDSLKYNISILEYFQFCFFEKTHTEKLEWAGTGTMYEYQLIMNPQSARDILDDKRKFHREYKKFVLHKTATREELKKNDKLGDLFLTGKSEKVVFKVAEGKCGAQVEIKSSKELGSVQDLIAYMKKNSYDLVEEYILQHPEMNRLSPSGVNTVRIITQLNSKNQVEILGCRQRISVNSEVDNMAAGNIVAVIDTATGEVCTPAVYSDVTKESVTVHPVTGTPITGFKVPFWKETLMLVKEAALLHPQNRSIGWDVVINETGPELIEGNHDWCKLVWQLPLNKGLKPVLDRHLKELKHV